jgi:undecaprenyl-diphosphatase
MRKIFAALCLLFYSGFLCAQENLENSDAVPSSETLTYGEAVVLGLVEGITEFIPVSSTGHLILANFFLDLDSDNPALGKDGNLIISRKTDDEGNPKRYTVKDALDGYAIVIQIAAIAAVALIYWREVLSMIMGVFGRDRKGLLLVRNLFAAFLPAAFIGFALHDLIEEFLFGVIPVVIALSLGAVAMVFMQRKYQKHFDDSSKPVELHELSVKQSLFVGFMQCVALWPGTSRSMMTILGAYAIGLKPVQAAKFSFLLGLVTLSAAGGYKFMKDGSEMTEALATGPMLLGFFVAFLSSALAAKWLVSFLSRKGLIPFALYRIILAAALAVMVLCNVGN